MKVNDGGTSLVADVGRFGDKHGVRNVSTTGTPLLYGANLRPLLTGGFASWGFEFVR